MELDPKQAAAALGRRGGLKRSARKAQSSRANLERARAAKAAAVPPAEEPACRSLAKPAARPVLVVPRA
jgi:hypothetical protein